jgi:hypothetical protein
VDTPADRRLAPDDDVMFYLRYMLSLPLFPGELITSLTRCHPCFQPFEIVARPTVGLCGAPLCKADLQFHCTAVLFTNPCVAATAADADADADAGSQTLTVRELVLDYANTVQQVAVQLHLLQRPPSMHCPQQQHPADRIKALLDR